MNYLIRPGIKIASYCFEKTSTKHKQNSVDCNSKTQDAGFSIIELLIVISIIGVMSSVTIFSFLGNKKAYQTDDQALHLIDFMRDAKERALSHRQVMRFEIDTTDKVIRIIDEGTTEISSGRETHANDKIVRQENLDNSAGRIRTDLQPTNISVLPNINPTTNSTLNCPAAVFAASSHPLSAGHNVWAVRFLSNGSATGPSDTSTVPISATVFVWQPDDVTGFAAAPVASVRAITLFGGAGTLKYWQYDGSKFVAR